MRASEKKLRISCIRVRHRFTWRGFKAPSVWCLNIFNFSTRVVHIRLWCDAKGQSASKYLLAFLLFLIILHHLDEGYIDQNTRGRLFQLFLHSLSSSFFVQIGAGEQPDETTIYCSRGSDRYVCFKAILHFLLLCGDCMRFFS